MRHGRHIWSAALALLALAAGAAPASAQFAPLDAPGPALSVPAAELRASLTCTGDLQTSANGTPVLLVHATGSDPKNNFGWNYIPLFDRIGRPHCEVSLDDKALSDIQRSAEKVVHSIRSMYRRSGGRIDIIGHSQGGMIPRWALRFWPDTREKVDDLVAIAASNHGTDAAKVACASACPVAFQQQRSDSRFTAALNSRTETFAGIDYTSIYTRFDEVVTPNQDAATGSTSLRVGRGSRTNVAAQDLCPLNLTEHLGLGTYDNVAYALARDALDNPGPAQPARVGTAPCSDALMPGVNRATYPTDSAASLTALLAATGQARQVSEEPPLRCYVTATCPATASSPRARLVLRVSPRRARVGRPVTVRLRARIVAPGKRSRPAARGRVRVGGRKVRLNGRGRKRVRLVFRSSGVKRPLVRLGAARSDRARIVVRRRAKR